MGPRVGLDDLEKGKISCLYLDSYPGSSIPQPVITVYTQPLSVTKENFLLKEYL